MTSIHRQQSEDHPSPLVARAAVEKIKEIAKRAPSCFFCTAAVAGTSQGARPMNVRLVDDEGNLWFLSASDSRKNEEIASDPTVTLFFQGSTHADFLHLSGRATVFRDRARIDALWEPVVRCWLTEGRDDPRVTVIKVTPTEGYYWGAAHTAAGVKMRVRAARRRTVEDPVAREILV